MIDVAQYKAEIAGIPGKSIILPRDQINELLGEVETGQAAKRALSRIMTIGAVSACTGAVPA
jgi:hypothetical protein